MMITYFSIKVQREEVTEKFFVKFGFDVLVSGFAVVLFESLEV